MKKFPQVVTCNCGQVKFEATAAPIVTAVCYCEDCQTAGDIIDRKKDVKAFRESDGGTPYVTLHDKHWVHISGRELLEPIKLKPTSPTVRFVTQCCHSPLFIKFKNGFWTSTYRARYEDPPKIEWRNKTAKRKSQLPYPDEVPRFEGFPLRLFARLLRAWIS